MSSVYLDTMVFIYRLEKDPMHWIASQRIFDAIRDGRHTLLSSVFVQA